MPGHDSFCFTIQSSSRTLQKGSIRQEGLVEKSGSWYSFNGNRIGQGRENAKKFLLDNAEISEEIENLIRNKNKTTEDEQDLKALDVEEN